MPAPDYASEIAALEAAAASGELTIEANGERVTYRNMTDLLAALNYFRGQASVAQSRQSRPLGTTVAAFSRE